MKWAKCAPIRAAISSSCGSVSFLRGATRFFAKTKEMWLSCRIRATAPYATVLASEKICNSTFSCGFIGSKKAAVFVNTLIDICSNT